MAATSTNLARVWRTRQEEFNKRVSALTKSLLAHDSRLQRWIGGINVGAVFLVAVGSALVSYSETTRTPGLLMAIIGAGVSVSASLWLLVFAQITPELQMAAEEARDLLREADEELKSVTGRLEQVSRSRKRFAVMVSMTRAHQELLERALAAPAAAVVPDDAVVGEMLDLLVLGRSTLFSMEGDAYDFSVFLADDQRTTLRNVGCRRSSRFREKSASPRIPSTFGIAGHAFISGKEYVCDDTAADQVFAAREEMDRKRYRSLAVVPIVLASGGSPTIGVLCAASDWPRRFSRTAAGSIEPLRSVSASLALYCAMIQYHGRPGVPGHG